ncbi:epithelial zinc-finger ezf protein [Ophiostoma piceae UAMH 11346]|uniref:Epithelial zinc-finger ezf protein n=1 Tax=Ophiostoma piceae (strain UAMH 11346) TaxID=1262450 RepID=S3CMR2_OPHP1|nr:epithelial zinc-finger ezf protein [Ophiostoma piceae UAMH 11346]
MDTTPSLNRFSSSPQNSYCPSEASSLEYHSPNLIAQQYSLSSLYVTGSFCSMESNQDSDIPLFALDTNQHPTWDHPTATLASNSSTGLPTALSVEYDPFGSFASSNPANYSSGIYSEGAHRPASLAGTHSHTVGGSHQSTITRSRSPLALYGPPPVLSSSTNVYQPGVVTSARMFGHIGDRSRFQHTRPAQFSSHTSSPDAYGISSSSGTLTGFLPVESASVWQNSAPGTEPLYSAPSGSHGQQTPSLASDQQQRGTRPRKQPRRLTTREEANFQCEVRGCGKLFSRSYNYKAHMETHDEGREYPFPCQVPDCDRKFVRKTDLQRHHQSVHVKERNHKCDYCGRLFARKDTLRRHMDDGCSKRFDLGTLDIGADGISNTGSGSQNPAWQV